MLHIAMFGEADVEVGQHILDTFEVDCGSIEERPLLEQYAP